MPTRRPCSAPCLGRRRRRLAGGTLAVAPARAARHFVFAAVLAYLDATLASMCSLKSWMDFSAAWNSFHGGTLSHKNLSFYTKLLTSRNRFLSSNNMFFTSSKKLFESNNKFLSLSNRSFASSVRFFTSRKRFLLSNGRFFTSIDRLFASFLLSSMCRRRNPICRMVRFPRRQFTSIRTVTSSPSARFSAFRTTTLRGSR